MVWASIFESGAQNKRLVLPDDEARNKANPSPFDQPVFYRLEMQAIEVGFVIVFIEQSMLQNRGCQTPRVSGSAVAKQLLILLVLH